MGHGRQLPVRARTEADRTPDQAGPELLRRRAVHEAELRRAAAEQRRRQDRRPTTRRSSATARRCTSTTGSPRRSPSGNSPDPQAPAGATDNLMIDFLSGMRANDAKNRFDISLFKEDANYVYLDVKPILPEGQERLPATPHGPVRPEHEVAVHAGAGVHGQAERRRRAVEVQEPADEHPEPAPKDFAYQKVAGFVDQVGKPPARNRPPGGRGCRCCPPPGGCRRDREPCRGP